MDSEIIHHGAPKYRRLYGTRHDSNCPIMSYGEHIIMTHSLQMKNVIAYPWKARETASSVSETRVPQKGRKTRC